jgi:hypothetical protein
MENGIVLVPGRRNNFPGMLEVHRHVLRGSLTQSTFVAQGHKSLVKYATPADVPFGGNYPLTYRGMPYVPEAANNRIVYVCNLTGLGQQSMLFTLRCQVDDNGIYDRTKPFVLLEDQVKAKKDYGWLGGIVVRRVAQYCRKTDFGKFNNCQLVIEMFDMPKFVNKYPLTEEDDGYDEDEEKLNIRKEKHLGDTTFITSVRPFDTGFDMASNCLHANPKTCNNFGSERSSEWSMLEVMAINFLRFLESNCKSKPV